MQQITLKNNRLLPKNIWIETSAEEFKPRASNIHESENRQKRIIIGQFCMFSLSIFQCKEQNHWLFYLINIWKNITVNSDLHRNLKCVVFEKEKLDYWNISILIAFCQSGFHFWCRGKLFGFSEMNSPRQVKSYQLTFWRKNEASRATKRWVWITKNIKTNNNFWQLWSLKIPLHGCKLLIFNTIFQQN